MRSCVRADRFPSARPLKTNDTAARETPARSATSRAVGRFTAASPSGQKAVRPGTLTRPDGQDNGLQCASCRPGGPTHQRVRHRLSWSRQISHTSVCLAEGANQLRGAPGGTPPGAA
ncbi:hypothetical protein SSPO_021660 [Streptomyces antimycoticus]|uniref:Uncharacterized protein n=1 Tax=Streptomyces antimycoticus TaxID=68175 RepID=A0A499UIQ5_9ACTN|nr:hypothetical protein SSPO_021660 [Streptomyces antimycoticus]